MSVSDPTTIDLSLPGWRDDPGQLKAELEQRLQDRIVIDASVSRPVDTLTVQVLLSARRAALTLGKQFELQNPSEAFENGLRQLGLFDDFFGKEV